MLTDARLDGRKPAVVDGIEVSFLEHANLVERLIADNIASVIDMALTDFSTQLHYPTTLRRFDLGHISDLVICLMARLASLFWTASCQQRLHGL